MRNRIPTVPFNGEVHNSLCSLVFALSNARNELIIEEVKKFGLTSISWSLLKLISNSVETDPKELAGILNFSSKKMSSKINSLKKLELVVIERRENGKLVILTPKGGEVRSILLNKEKKLDEMMMDGLSIIEQKKVIRLLGKTSSFS